MTTLFLTSQISNNILWSQWNKAHFKKCGPRAMNSVSYLCHIYQMDIFLHTLLIYLLGR